MTLMNIGRYVTFALCVALFLLCAGLAWRHGQDWEEALCVLFFALSVVGVRDLLQLHHSILRNYPVLGHVRWLAETVRPEIRQYLMESDEDAAPFSRVQRSVVYARAKNEGAERAFGSLLDVYEEGYEYLGHSVRPAPLADPASFRIVIGEDQCAQPYSASVFNISAMSFGALGAAAIRALNKGAKLGNFSHDTGEGSISPYHREFGGDIVWQVASGYFGCRTTDGRFDPDKFAAQAKAEQIKMIEIKISQGAKPGHGGILPAEKVTAEIAETRGVPMGVDCISPSRHSAFSTPLELMDFIVRLRELSGGKPVGFKLCIGQPWEFMAMVKAMLATGVRPDFIVVDGAEGGTGAAPVEFTDHMGTPMREGLLLVHNTLVGAGLRDKIRIGVAGKIVTAMDIATVMAIGADWANAARGFMFSLGCVQSLHCNTNRCPTGVATQDATRQRGLVVEDKAERVRNFHRNTLKALAEILAAAGLEHPAQLRPYHVLRRIGRSEVRPFSELHVYLRKGELIDNAALVHPFYRAAWAMAQAESFEPAEGHTGADLARATRLLAE